MTFCILFLSSTKLSDLILMLKNNMGVVTTDNSLEKISSPFLQTSDMFVH